MDEIMQRIKRKQKERYEKGETRQVAIGILQNKKNNVALVPKKDVEKREKEKKPILGYSSKRNSNSTTRRKAKFNHSILR